MADSRDLGYLAYILDVAQGAVLTCTKNSLVGKQFHHTLLPR